VITDEPDVTAIDVIFDSPAEPLYDLTLAGLADDPAAFWLARGLDRLAAWVAAPTDPQLRRERAEYANAVIDEALRDLTAYRSRTPSITATEVTP
jgi:hypothetical protein